MKQGIISFKKDTHLIKNPVISFKKDTYLIKKTKHLEKNIFIIFSLRRIEIEPATFKKLTLKLLYFYCILQTVLLDQNFSETHLMKLLQVNNAYGWKY